jgi:hypothetical protein
MIWNNFRVYCAAREQPHRENKGAIVGKEPSRVELDRICDHLQRKHLHHIVDNRRICILWSQFCSLEVNYINAVIH